nr:retrovirus-related Pol polyprotein from transposon TNT 1-94 [Tanacetum cinerariifolium]
NYKPTNHNIITSLNLRNKNVDTTPWYKNNNQSGQFGNQRTMNVAEARENAGSPSKRVKDFAYHKEKMLLCEQAEKGVPLQAKQYDWLADIDEEIDEQELEAHYNYMAKIQEVPTADSGTDSEPLEKVQNNIRYNVFVDELQHSEQSESISNTCLVETDDSNVILDSPDMCDDDIQNDQNNVESDDELVKEKHDELTKQSLLTKSHYEGLVKQKTKFAPILRYGDLVQGNITINRVYYVKGLNHNLFSVSQFCDVNLELAFWKSTCFIRDLQGNNLLTDNRGSDLYTISLQESTSATALCLMAKALPTQAWFWHRRLSHFNFDYINLLLKKDVVIGLPKLKYVKDQLYSCCEVSKAKRSSFKSKTVPSMKGRLNLLHMDLCGPMKVASINEMKYILVIIDD